ncbi:unnamed protein product, partial [Protopolystoma xenopodis]
SEHPASTQSLISIPVAPLPSTSPSGSFLGTSTVDQTGCLETDLPILIVHTPSEPPANSSPSSDQVAPTSLDEWLQQQRRIIDAAETRKAPLRTSIESLASPSPSGELQSSEKLNKAEFGHPSLPNPRSLDSFMEYQIELPKLVDFTLEEYTEKLFSASLPLAPLILLLVGISDIRVDARRLLQLYQRPVPRIAGSIGRCTAPSYIF